MPESYLSGATESLGIPYPTPDDPYNPAGDMHDIASAIDTAVDNRVTDAEQRASDAETAAALSSQKSQNASDTAVATMHARAEDVEDRFSGEYRSVIEEAINDHIPAIWDPSEFEPKRDDTGYQALVVPDPYQRMSGYYAHARRIGNIVDVQFHIELTDFIESASEIGTASVQPTIPSGAQIAQLPASIPPPQDHNIAAAGVGRYHRAAEVVLLTSGQIKVYPSSDSSSICGQLSYMVTPN